MAEVVIRRRENGSRYFTYEDRGKVLMTSEARNSEKSIKKMITSFKRTAKGAKVVDQSAS